MPVIKKRLSSGKVQVKTPGGIKAKATTPAKANAQVKLLNAIDHGFVPTGKTAKPPRTPKMGRPSKRK